MKPAFCVFNRSRECFLGVRVGAADTLFTRLKGALGRIGMHPLDGIWLVPSRGIHTIGMLFAMDLIYLDAHNRVIHLVEQLGPFRISPIRIGCASILELKTRSIYSSNTRLGDQLVICAPEEIDQYCASDSPLPAMEFGQARGGR
jgi:uncharacterized membrane protein (UPF0127 family)